MKLLGVDIPFTNFVPVKSFVKPPLAIHGTGGFPGRDFGNQTTFRSDGSKWRGGISGNNSSMVYNHDALRNNARNAYQDSVPAHAIITRWADSVADTGIKLDCNPNIEILGITSEFAEKWASDVEQRHNLWANDRNANRSESMNWYQSHRLYQLDDKRDGENFIRFYYSKEKKLQNPLQFEIIDPNQIRGTGITYALGPYANDDGIERDERGREKAYKIWSTTFVNNIYKFKFETVDRIGSKSKRIMMLHGYSAEYPGQQRGISKLAHILQELQNLTDFTSAQIMKAINQSNLVMSVENSVQDPSNPTENESIQMPGGFGNADEVDPTGDAEEVNRVEYKPLPEVDTRIPGSKGYFNLTKGDKLKAFENSAPSDGFESFKDSFYTDLASSTGMSIEAVQMKFGSSFSAARGALILFWRVAMIERAEMSSDYLNPSFEMWLSGEIASGRIQAPGWNDPVLRKAWLNCSWIGAPMPNIDPTKTAKADKEYLEMNATNLQRVARDLNGSDSKSNILKNAKSFADMPIPPWANNSKSDYKGDSDDDEIEEEQ